MTDKPKAAGQLKADFGGIPLEGNRFVFTAAQNNTYLHEKFFKALLRYCDDTKAELVVAKFRYNKNAFQNLSEDNENEEIWYDQRLEPYFLTEQATIRRDLIWCGELNILPTAVNPLSGLENYTRDASCIVPHAKVQMKSVPTMKHEPTKFMYTTGAVTLRNYIPQKAGQKASFNHMFAALFVEVDEDGDWFARQLVANNEGEFQDLTTKYTSRGIERDKRIEALTFGDIHSELTDKLVAEASWGAGSGSMTNVLRPKKQFAHDLTDFRARNHHNLNDPHILASYHARGADSVREGLLCSAVWLAIADRPWSEIIVVESNHDQALMRWLKDPRGAMDPVNSGYWHELNAYAHKELAEGRQPHVFEYAIRSFCGPYSLTMDRVRFLREDETYEICRTPTSPGIECGMHGHRGPNGSRGSIRNLRNIGKRANIGHSHEAGIVDGVYQAGVSAPLDMGYNVGPSSWSNTHIVTYPSGKRTLVTIRNGKWRA